MPAPNELPPPPAGIRVAFHPDGLTVKRQWRNMASWALLPLALVANVTAVAVSHAMWGLPWSDPMWALPIVHAGAALAFSLFVLRRCVNVTQVDVTSRQITVRHGPLPWKPALVVPADSIQRLEVRKRHWYYEGSRVTDYHLWAILRGGGEVALLQRDEDREQAQWAMFVLHRMLPHTETA